MITELKAANPDYEKHITFIDVDEDKFGHSYLMTWLNIPRCSTLVVLHQDDEHGRIVASTKRDDINDLMDTALAAAGA